jgi:ribosomal protein S27AE
MNLELTAMRWLWLDKGCLTVLEQRTPSYCMGVPDVLGITPGRYMVEVEIKRTYSDFKADATKIHRLRRGHFIRQQPRQFYYLMPSDLAAKCLPEVPSWAGLMACPYNNKIEILKIAPVNSESRKLDLKQCVRLARMMTNHMMSYAVGKCTATEARSSRANFSHVDWVDCEVGTYEI